CLIKNELFLGFLFSSRRRHTRFSRDWSSDVCSSDLSFFIINSLLKFKKFRKRKGDKPNKQRQFNKNKGPKKNSPSHWVQPKKIFNKQRYQQIQQPNGEKKDCAFYKLVGVVFLNKFLQFLLDDVESAHSSIFFCRKLLKYNNILCCPRHKYCSKKRKNLTIQ